MSHDWSGVNPLCIIPARGGSKRIRGKNVRELEGQPIISRTIEVARASQIFQEIAVSTDNDEIAKCAETAGAVIPFKRHKSLADEKTGLQDVITDSIQHLSLDLFPNSLICCLLPSAVLLEPADLVDSYADICSDSRNVFLVSGTRFAHPIERALFVAEDGLVYSRESDSTAKRTQDCIEFWHDAGQFYWATVATWLTKSRILEGARLYPLPSYRAVDLDTEEDWNLLEALHFYKKAQDGSKIEKKHS